MNRLVQEAVVIGLARRLSEQGSWTGETHLQKAAYLLSELRGVDFEFNFILYKHGPFSFELRDDLGYMRAEGLLDRYSRNPRYGPQFRITERGHALERSLEKTMERYGNGLDWVAHTLGARGVGELESLATAMWMTRRYPNTSVTERAEALRREKPHISLEDATAAVEEIDRLLSENAAFAS